jgi:hypothetical protein
MIYTRIGERRSAEENLFHGPASFLVFRFSLALCAVATMAAAQGEAQVMELGDGGAVTLYDGPSVITSAGSTPIVRPRRAAGRASHRTLASETAAVSDRGVIAQAASAADLSPALVEAVAWRESRLTQGIVSSAGAVGEMQLMPATARALGVDPRVSQQNFSGGAAYLRLLMHHYDGDLLRTLAAYNAGPGAVDRYGGVPPFKETQAYVAAVMDRLSRNVPPSDPPKRGGN